MIIMLLIFTTSGAGGYTALTKNYGHINLSELLYFAFIWSIGFEVPATVNQAFERGDSKSRVCLDILKRSSILVITGAMIDATISQRTHPEFVLWRPLQRAGLTYFAAATAYAFASKRITTPSESGRALSLVWCWIIGATFVCVQLIGMSTVMSFNVPPVPLFSAAELVDKSDVMSRVTNIQSDLLRDYVNKLFLSQTEFVYLNSYYGFCKGLLGIFSSISQCLVGLIAGSVYHQYRRHGDRIRLWCFWGVLFMLISVCLMIMSSEVFNLWPVSSIFFVASLSFFFHTAIYMVTEKTTVITNATVHSCGVTSVVILFGHLVFSKSFPFSWNIVFRNHLVYLLQNAWVVTLWFIVAAYVAKRGLRLSI